MPVKYKSTTHVDMRTNPIGPMFPGIFLPHRHGLFKHRDDPAFLLQLPTIQLQTNPIALRLRVKMIGRLDQPFRHGRGMRESPVSMEGGREVRS